MADDFFGVYEIDQKNIEICDQIVKYFQESPNKHKPYAYKHGKISPAPEEVKQSTDLTIYDIDSPCLSEYLNILQECCQAYIKKFPFCDYYNSWRITEPFNIQHYAPTQGYHAWHTERGSAESNISARHLVFMTYLNDVSDGGGTEFFHQNKTFSAKKGQTIIWPSDWTYTHRGIPSPTQDKYIITGWFSYID